MDQEKQRRRFDALCVGFDAAIRQVHGLWNAGDLLKDNVTDHSGITAKFARESASYFDVLHQKLVECKGEWVGKGPQSIRTLRGVAALIGRLHDDIQACIHEAAPELLTKDAGMQEVLRHMNGSIIEMAVLAFEDALQSPGNTVNTRGAEKESLKQRRPGSGKKKQ